MVLLTIRVISEGREEMNMQRLLLLDFFSLAAISESSDLFIVTLLTYFVSSGMMFPAFLGEESSPPPPHPHPTPTPPPIFMSCWIWENSFALSPNHSILFHCMLVKWKKCFFWPVKCSSGLLKDRPQTEIRSWASYFQGHESVCHMPRSHFPAWLNRVS